MLAFDAAKRRLYVSAESGMSFLATEAHTVAVDPSTHLVYLPLQSGSNGRPQLLIMRPA